MKESVLIVGTNWLGDSIMAMPAVQGYRRTHPGRRLAMLAKPKCSGIWSLHPDIDDVITCPETPAGTLRAVLDVRRRRFEDAFVLPHSIRSALVPFLAHIPRRTGLPGHHRDWMLTDIVEPDPDSCNRHQCYEYMRLFGLRDFPAEPPKLAIPVETAGRLRAMLGDAGKNAAALIPGAAYGPSKRWPAERFAEVGRLLNGKYKCGILIVGSDAERELCANVAAGAGSAAINLCGRTTIPELAAVLAGCSVAVTNDSGGMHLAAAVGTPVVAIFGITDPVRTGPLGKLVCVLQDSAIRSRDLRRNSCAAEESLRRITAARVFEAASDLIERGQHGS